MEYTWVSLFCIIAIVVYILFYIVLYRLLSSASNTKTILWESTPVSIIICASNEKDNLARLIPALLSQQYVDFEIIVAVNATTDDTIQYLNTAYGTRLWVLDLKEVPTGINSKKYALQQAVAQARHDWLLLTDADCIPESEYWIRDMMRVRDQDTRIIIGYSPYLYTKGIVGLFVQLDTFFTAFQYILSALIRKPYMGVGRNMAYHKTVFADSKLMDQYAHVTGGDDDLLVNMAATSTNTKVSIHRNTWMWSYPKTSVNSWLAQKIRHLSVGKKYKVNSLWIPVTFTIVRLLAFMSLIYSIVVFNQLIFIISMIKILFTTIYFAKIAKSIFVYIPWWQFIWIEPLYNLVYIYLNIVTLFKKNIEWKK